MGAPIVFFDIAGPDLAAQSDFYSDVFAWDIRHDGCFTVTVQSPVQAALRRDGADKLLYIGVEDIEATLDKVIAKGGTVVTPRFEVPGVVVLGVFADPAGNSMGLVEMPEGQSPDLTGS